MGGVLRLVFDTAALHIGPMRVEAGDVFGGTVNFAARVVGAVKDAEIWLSERAKEDIDRLGAGKHKGLKWERHEGLVMKGFPGKFTLWAVGGMIHNIGQYRQAHRLGAA